MSSKVSLVKYDVIIKKETNQVWILSLRSIVRIHCAETQVRGINVARGCVNSKHSLDENDVIRRKQTNEVAALNLHISFLRIQVGEGSVARGYVRLVVGELPVEQVAPFVRRPPNGEGSGVEKRRQQKRKKRTG